MALPHGDSKRTRFGAFVVWFQCAFLWTNFLAILVLELQSGYLVSPGFKRRPHIVTARKLDSVISKFGFSVSPCVHHASLPVSLLFGACTAIWILPSALRGVSFAILSGISSDLSYVARVSRPDLSVG